MRRSWIVERAAVVACVLTTACGGPSSAPAANAVAPTALTPPAASPGTTAGRTIDATSDAPVGQVVIGGDGVTASAPSPAGTFTLYAVVDGGVPHGIAFLAPAFVPRQTYLRVPGPEALVTLIPRAFDLLAFDEMCRASVLTRWRNAPPLRIQTQTFQFTSIDDTTLRAIDETMSDNDYASLLNDLTWALPQLTGDAFRAFMSVTRAVAAPDEVLPLLANDSITVTRVAGLTRATGFAGYSRWRLAGDGTVTGGLITLDRDGERLARPSRRALRSHELGHSLGYNHVTVRESVMNAAAVVEPNDFDRLASRLAFQRLPGNRSPDVDPTAALSVNRVSATWGPPIP